MSNHNTRPDSRQIKKRQALPKLGTIADASVETVLDQLHVETDSPLRIYAAAIPDSNLYIRSSIIAAADGANKSHPPIKSQIYNILDSTIDFQTQTTTGASFVISFPASTVGFFRRVGFSLLGNGEIQALFSAEASSIGALPNPGTVFVRSGIPMGYVELECTNSAGLFKSAGAASNVITADSIFRMSQGGGGGQGAGDANSFTENLKHRLVSSFYEYVTPVVFEADEESLTAAATASFNIVDGVYEFSAAGQLFTSVNMFDTDFLNNDHDSRQIELHAEWFDSASIDTNATYEVSLNGSAFETLTMARQGSTLKYTGDKILNIPASVTLLSQPNTDTNTELNASTLQAISAPFTISNKSAANQLVVELDKLGSPSGSYIVSIAADNAGVPGDIIYSKISLISDLAAGLNVITLNDFRNVLAVGSYHILIQTDATYKSSFSTGVTALRVKTQSAGNDIVFDGTNWSISTVDVKYTLSGHVYDLRVRVTSSAGDKKLKAFGIFYDEAVGDVQTGFTAIQKFVFSGDSNTRRFTVTKFLPDPDLTRVYDISTGQVYRYPAFSIDGHDLVFPAGTFNVPGETLELIVDQTAGSSFDNSENNANLLASNHLGSTDTAVDKSSSGRGIMIRNANGELKELWLDASNNLNITDPL